MKKTCTGCGYVLPNNEAMHALSRYGHGSICSGCGRSEAFYGDFITRYGKEVKEYEARGGTSGVYPYDILMLRNITA